MLCYLRFSLNGQAVECYERTTRVSRMGSSGMTDKRLELTPRHCHYPTSDVTWQLLPPNDATSIRAEVQML